MEMLFLLSYEQSLPSRYRDTRGESENQKLPARPTKFEVLESVAIEYGVSLDEIIDRRDGRAYKAAVYLLRRVVNLDLKTVAKEFGISTTRVSKIQGESERMDKIDLKLLKLLRKYKVKQ